MRIDIEMEGGGDSDVALAERAGGERSALVTVSTRSAGTMGVGPVPAFLGKFALVIGLGSTGNAKWGSWDLDMSLLNYGKASRGEKRPSIFPRNPAERQPSDPTVLMLDHVPFILSQPCSTPIRMSTRPR